MQALTYVGEKAVEWREVPEPRLESDRAALVRPKVVSTCDLDALIVAGRSPFAPPFTLGHECVAEIVELGDEVESLQTGEFVSVPFQISCGECGPCRAGHSGNCASLPFMSTYGFGPAVQRYGGFLSDLVSVPYAEHMLVPLPAGLDPVAVASASDNLSDAWRAVGPQLIEAPRSPVLVIGGAGPGSIGLYAVAIAVALGAEAVVYLDADPRRRETAAALGAQVLADAPKRLGPYPITVDAGGDPALLALALRATAPDGVCTSTAIYFGEQPQLPLLAMYTNGVTFTTGRVHAREAMPQVLELAVRGSLRPERITSRVVRWDEARDALLDPPWTKLVFER
ncbi:MAG TPA: alcohol dehydrogenase catalytic domain-containing protein [Solirubrobacteraceae bacterium]|nr:alcohol dehydrogenase catalytic domain-containing protein [Solirubrobacteraceae bacterium]